MSELCVGNVIEAPNDGGMWIVTNIHEAGAGKPALVEAVAFDAENCSAVQRLDDYMQVYTCHCGDHPDFDGEPQSDCERCHGRGSYTTKELGWRRSKVLAPHVKAFILQGMKRMFKI